MTKTLADTLATRESLYVNFGHGSLGFQANIDGAQ